MLPNYNCGMAAELMFWPRLPVIARCDTSMTWHRVASDSELTVMLGSVLCVRQSADGLRAALACTGCVNGTVLPRRADFFAARPGSSAIGAMALPWRVSGSLLHTLPCRWQAAEGQWL